MKIFTPIMAFLALMSGVITSYADERVASLVGFMEFRYSWNEGMEPIAEYGFYQFASDGSSTDFTPVSPTGMDNNWASDGAVYANGKYYCFSSDGTWLSHTLTYRVIDANTWQTEKSVTYSSINSADADQTYLQPSDMAYDAVNNVIYVIAHKYAGDSDNYLCSVDPETGKFTRLGSTPRLKALTASPFGQLYAIGNDANLYKVAVDGTTTLVGNTGYYCIGNGDVNISATYDYQNNVIYWAFEGYTSEEDRRYLRNAVRGLVEIDPVTANSSMKFGFDDQVRFSALNIEYGDPMAPEEIFDLSFKPDRPESLTGIVSFTIPEVTGSQELISGNVSVRVYIDNKLQITSTEPRGTEFSRSIPNLTQGEHIARVDLTLNGHTNKAAVAKAFFGIDVPAKVKNVVLTPNADRTAATISWEAPTTGAAGSEYDMSKIRYRVVRYPDETVVKRSMTETSLTDDIPYEYVATYYAIIPYHVDHPTDLGAKAVSNTEMLGHPITLPYEETFDTSASFRSFTVIDCNPEASPVDDAAQWMYDEEYYCAFYNGSRDVVADDWLITPPLKFEKNRLYRLRFKYYGYYGYGLHFDVYAGSEADVAHMKKHVLEVSSMSSFSDRPGIDADVIFAPGENDRFIGFHHNSTSMEHLSIDDIWVVDCGDARVPDAVGALTAIRLNNESATLRFTMPKVNAAGGNLEGDLVVKIYRDIKAQPIATLNGKKAGESVEWTDENAINGINQYTVLVSNGYGDGLQASTQIDLAGGIPGALTGVKAEYINDRQIIVTWNALTSNIGVNGNEFDLDAVRYMVYKPGIGENGLLTYNLVGRDLSEPRFVDDNPFANLEESQCEIYYLVAPINGSGEGDAAVSNSLVIGEAYTLPFSETWLNQNVSTAPWLKKQSNGASWGIRHQGYDPSATGYDGYGLISCEIGYGVNSGVASIQTPRIDLTTAVAPEASFYMWTSPVYDNEVSLSVALDIEGHDGLVNIPKVYKAKAATAGWTKITIPLAEYAGNNRVSIVLTGNVKTDNHIHIDNFTVSGTGTNEFVRPLYIEGESSLRVGQETSMSACVINRSDAKAENVNVSIKVGETVLATGTIKSVAAGKTGSVYLKFVPGESLEGRQTLTLSIDKADGVKVDNLLTTKEVNVKPENPAVVDNLAATQTHESINLSWSAPVAGSIAETHIDSFETYESFAIDNIGHWTTVDIDKLIPFQFGNGQGGYISWPNSQTEQAYIVFAPNELDVDTPFSAKKGRKMLVSMAGAVTADGGADVNANNDWLISPELTGEAQTISFYVSALMGGSAERYHVLISRTDNDPESFIRLNGNTPLVAPASWGLVHFELPEGTKYFAINYVGSRQDGLMIDEMMYYGFPPAEMPQGYNIYRDGVKLNADPLEVPGYVDTDVELGNTYTYIVKCLYNGNETAPSNEVTVGFDSADITMAGATPVVVDGLDIVVSGTSGMSVDVFGVNGAAVASAIGDCRLSVIPGVYIVRVGSAFITKVVVR